jgi:hypothetical protein
MKINALKTNFCVGVNMVVADQSYLHNAELSTTSRKGKALSMNGLIPDGDLNCIAALLSFSSAEIAHLALFNSLEHLPKQRKASPPSASPGLRAQTHTWPLCAAVGRFIIDSRKISNYYGFYRHT